MSKHSFPVLKNDCLLRAARGLRTERVPVWIMRQAGRYLPEFRKVREEHSFFEICRTPALACEITLQPIRRYALDAAIIFSDILVIPQALGMQVEMKPSIGPHFPEPLSEPKDVEKLKKGCIDEELSYVYEAITLTRHELDGLVPLIGFTGAPWTLMCYMIEGGSSKTLSKAKSWLYKWPEESHNLLHLLKDAVISHLVNQIKAGAQLVQIFESNAEYLTPDLLKKFSLPYLKEIQRSVSSTITNLGLEMVPMILYAKGSAMVLDFIADMGYDVLGVDWTVAPSVARSKFSEGICLQGNLDPPALKADHETIKRLVIDMLQGFGTQSYIANLGHGIYPDIPPDNVAFFVNTIHEESEKMIKAL
ncbi:uroporphyrinogen decarboxylase-like [Uloborus diversus]|uniref:uroporphyrinogen decarboxylase-like n=1 Tax=Uloborus diversus TaxID=327109 RepID=UPI00240A284F|nr:uroporphyrinogen decarboxylase-like [Uloborus diversus]